MRAWRSTPTTLKGIRPILGEMSCGLHRRACCQLSGYLSPFHDYWRKYAKSEGPFRSLAPFWQFHVPLTVASSA